MALLQAEARNDRWLEEVNRIEGEIQGEIQAHTITQTALEECQEWSGNMIATLGNRIEALEGHLRDVVAAWLVLEDKGSIGEATFVANITAAHRWLTDQEQGSDARRLT